MTLETILKAAASSMTAPNAKRSPHCFSSHVVGQGHTGDSNQPDYKAQLARAVQSEIDNIGFAPGYVEPGYTDPKKAVLFANWNVFPRNFDRVLEKAGYECEWNDEWSTCEECGKAVRTSPDSYHFTSYYRILNECELVCLDCLDAAEYLESIEDNCQSAVPPQAKFHPEANGYTKHNGKFETGLHVGMNDKPADILKALHAEGKRHVVFRIAENSQFYTTWEAYYKEDEA